MLRKIHQIEIIVNGEPIEVYDPDKLNLRINNVLYKPEEITSKNGEYSFSFDIPATPKNNSIFNYANNMSKTNKFSTLYDCSVNVDGLEIFKGSIRLTDTQEDKYTCNLISVKVNKVEDIFGDTMMNELEWKIDFTGTDTINDYNSDENNYGLYFPLVCYGAFQKEPYLSYGNDYNLYTDLLQIDSWNRWYWESFHPSVNLIELMNRMFAQKGYTLSGNILNDRVLNQIYLSEYIDASQDPTLNLNSDVIGKLSVAGVFTPSMPGARTQRTSSNSVRRGGVVGETKSYTTSICNTLVYPKGKVVEDEYDYDHVFVYDIFATPASTTDTTAKHYMSTPPSNDYIYRHDKDTTSGFIQIPADGLYTIEFEASVDLTAAFAEMNNIRVSYQKKKKNNVGELEYEEIQISPQTKVFETMPVEVQLVRNTDEPELIWTAESVMTGSANIPSEAAKGLCQYPHEANTNAGSEYKGNTGKIVTSFPTTQQMDFGDRYYVDKGTVVAYDPKVNDGFICGFTSENKSPSVLKNGRSWDASVDAFNQTHYRQPGYKKCIWGGNYYTGNELTDKNSNTLNCPNTDYWTQTSNTGNGKITCVVELKKNDIIYLKMLTKGLNRLRQTTYTTGGSTSTEQEWGTYNPKLTYNLTITPYTDKKDKYLNSQDMYYLPDATVKEKGWGTKLNIGNFMHKNEKMSDFINNVINTFNLEYRQEGTNVFLNTMKTDELKVMADIDIDDRVMTKEAKASRIDYPNSMQVKWSIADDEAGAYRSIDTVEHQGANNWKDYIDTGSDRIMMDTTNQTNDETVESKFSYTWYQDFTYFESDSEGSDTGNTYVLRLPLIAKDEYFITQNEEAMQNDGLSLRQRLWFRSQDTRLFFNMWDGSQVSVQIPVNQFDDTILNFRDGNGTLLDRYFNVQPTVNSNYLTIECYLTPFEYLALKNGANVHFDNDLYLVSEVIGFDATGTNKTELKLIKK